MRVSGVFNRFVWRASYGGALAAAMGCSGPTDSPIGSTSRELWAASIAHVGLTPAVDSSRVYFGDLNQKVYAVEKGSGAVVWSSNIGNPTGAPFGLALQVTVAGPVVAVPNGAVLGFDRGTGTLRWQFHPPSTGFQGVVAADSTTVYAGSTHNELFAIDATTGTERWRLQVTPDTGANALVPTTAQNTVYVGVDRRTSPTSTGGLAAVDARTGQRLWFTEFPRVAPNVPSGCLGGALMLGDVVVARSDGGQLYGLNRVDGAIRWTVGGAPVLPQAYGDQRPIVAAGTLVVAGSTSGSVAAYDGATGVLMWQRKFDGSIDFPFVSDGHRVYFNDSGGTLFALDASTGTTQWTFGGSQTNVGALLLGPAIDGAAVYAGGSKAAYAVRKE